MTVWWGGDEASVVGEGLGEAYMTRVRQLLVYAYVFALFTAVNGTSRMRRGARAKGCVLVLGDCGRSSP